jgi:hypothetical protein
VEAVNKPGLIMDVTSSRTIRLASDGDEALCDLSLRRPVVASLYNRRAIYSAFEPFKRFRFLTDVEYSIGWSPILPAIDQLSRSKLSQIGISAGEQINVPQANRALCFYCLHCAYCHFVLLSNFVIVESKGELSRLGKLTLYH